MGYRIDYQPVRKIRGVEKRVSTELSLSAIFFALFLLLVNAFWQEGSEVIRGLLFSGDAAVAASALEDFALELRMGETVSSAFVTFCRKVMDGAQLGTG